MDNNNKTKKSNKNSRFNFIDYSYVKEIYFQGLDTL